MRVRFHLRFAMRGSIFEGFKTTQSVYSVCVVTKWLFARTNITMERLRKSCTPNKRENSATALIPEWLGQAGDSLPGSRARRPKLSRQKGVLLSTSHSKTSIEWLQHAVVGLPGCEQPRRLASAAKYRVRLHCESSSDMLQPSIPAHSQGKQPK